jgi:hypothetical protein
MWCLCVPYAKPSLILPFPSTQRKQVSVCFSLLTSLDYFSISIPSQSAFAMHKYDFAAKRRRRWIVCAFCLYSNLTAQSLFLRKIIGSSIALVVLIAVGVAVGVVLSKNNDSSQGSSNAQNSSSGSSNNDNPSNDPSNDPSIFAKDPSFHKSLYGMAYTPEGSLLPNCGNSLGLSTSF